MRVIKWVWEFLTFAIKLLVIGLIINIIIAGLTGNIKIRHIDDGGSDFIIRIKTIDESLKDDNGSKNGW
jgi:hypothetical protein